MFITQYTHRLPADYDMELLSKNKSSVGHERSNWSRLQHFRFCPDCRHESGHQFATLRGPGCVKTPLML
jgi:hypothetical protein